MTNESSDVSEFLEHFGIRGMKWGVRRGENRLHNKRAKMFGEDEANRLYFDNISKRTYKKVQTEALKNVKEPIKKIDSKPEYSDVNLLMNKRAMDDYYHEIDRAFEKELDKSLVNVLGTDKSPSGKFTAKHQIDPETGAVKILVLKQKEISHDNSEMIFDVEIDEKGHILDIVPREDLVQDAVKNVDEFLEHFGVKGQKWGVRRELKRIGRADQRFEKLQGDKKLRQKLIQQARDNSHDDLNDLKEKWSSRAYDTVVGPKLMPTDYYGEAYGILNKHLDTLSREYTNSSGTKRLKAQYAIDPETGIDYFVVRTEDLQHSFGNEVKLSVKKDEKGMITDIEFPEELFDLLQDDSLEQDALSPAEEFLSHHGIKGMKWGVRRKNPGRAFATRVEDLPDSEGKDALKILAKQKKHGTVALTNHELRTINARQKLEQEFAKANPKEKGKIDKGHDHVKKYLAIGMTAKQAYDLMNSPAGKALRDRGGKKAAQIAAQKAAQKAMWELTVGRQLGFNK